MEEIGMVGMEEGTYCGSDQVDKSWFHFVEAWKGDRREEKEREAIIWEEDENGVVWGRY